MATRRSPRTTRFVSIVLLFVLLLDGCQLPLPGRQATPTAIPTDAPTAVPQVTATPEATTAPTPTNPPPQGTPTPLDLAHMPRPAPRLLYIAPGTGEELALDAPVELVFDQPMYRPSVEAAFAISPTVPGWLFWKDDRTLSFQADGELPRGARYHVHVDSSAQNIEGTPMEAAAAFSFSTIGYLEVTQVQPAANTTELNPDTAVTVVFNRPVVPLTAISGRTELPNPLSFDPPVAGKTEWLNTSILIFRPDEGFLPGVRYRAHIAAGLTDTMGGVLAGDYIWNFSTYRPAIVETSPAASFQYTAPTTTVSITFNQPMDHASAEQRFSLKTGDQPVTGTFQWNGAETAMAQETMTFVPTEAFSRSTRYQATLAAGTLARSGQATVEKARSWTFDTVKPPAILSIQPKDGSKSVERGADVVITFASPMRRQDVLDHLTITPEPDRYYDRWERNDTKLTLYCYMEPATHYTVTLSGESLDLYGLPAAKGISTTFTTENIPPYVGFNTGGGIGVFNAYTHTSVFVAYYNISRLDITLVQGNMNSLTTYVSHYIWPSENNPLRQWSIPITVPLNQRWQKRLDITMEDGSDLPPGVYFLSVSTPNVNEDARFVFVRSRLNVTMKQGLHEALVWATDLQSGQPVSGLPVKFFAHGNRECDSGTTGADGLFYSESKCSDQTWPFYAMTGEVGQDNFAVVYETWGRGISSYDFNIRSGYYDAGPYIAYAYTERPIYRPGQSVYYKVIVRTDDDAHYNMPDNLKTVKLEIYDPERKVVYRQNLTLNELGTASGEFVLDAEPTLGTYRMYITGPKDLWESTSFLVAEYRKPDYQVSVASDRAEYTDGDTIAVTVQSNYYFGGGVAGAKLQWNVLTKDYTFQYKCPGNRTCPRYSWTPNQPSYWDWYDREPSPKNGELIAQGEAMLDDQGRATFEVPVDIAQYISSQRYTLEANVTDLNGQQVSNRIPVAVHKGDFYVGVAPQGYVVQAGRAKEIKLLTADWASQPVAGIPLTVVLIERRWYSVKKFEDGDYYWTSTLEETPILTQTVTTADDGRASVSIVPPSAGSYRIQAIGYDQAGHKLTSSGYFWVWGGRDTVFWRRDSNDRIELIPDKEEYQVGDVAEILIPSPYTGATYALVTIERGHILSTEVRRLSGSTTVLQIPIREEYSPNIFVSVVLVEGAMPAPDGLASFKMGLVGLPVSIESKELKITLTPDRSLERDEHYNPRQTATYDVLVTDWEGNPVEAELSMRLADLAVLALADEPGPGILDTFWFRRGLGVHTSTPLTIAMEAFNRELREGQKGGSGGGGISDEGFIRSNFPDTAYWEAHLHTGPDGRAQVQVTLPDNLTTWRMQARAIDAQTRVGQAEVDIMSTLDMLLRPVLPRFFVVGDKAQIGTIVHNNTSTPQDVRVELAVEGLALDGPNVVTVTVDAHSKLRVDWPVTALAGSQAKVTMAIHSNTLADAREDTLPIYYYSTPEVVATAGRISEPGARQELVQLPPFLDSTQGELTVQVDGSLTAATQNSLKYLEYYPYFCIEQTISRFLPNVLTYQVLKEMGLERPEMEEKLKELVSVSVQRLYAGQNYDGGWGWWNGEASNAYLTAYALQGLLEANRAGFAVSRKVMDNAARYLSSHLKSVSGIRAHWEANRLAYDLYVLAEYRATSAILDRQPKEGPEGSDDSSDPRQSSELSIAVQLFEKREMLDSYGKAFLALALELYNPEETSRSATLLHDLYGKAVVSATGTHWEEGEPDYWNMNTDIRSTAIILWAMSQLQPKSELLPNVVRWLMSARQADHWESTHDTAWALLSLVAYMRATGEMNGDFSYAVYLNGEVQGEGDITQDTITQSHELQVQISQLLLDDANRVVVQRKDPTGNQTGEGQLYYTAYLRYFLPAEMVKAMNHGIVVSRQYTKVDDPDTPVTSAKVGDVIKVRITLVAPTDLYYVMVEDPLPAGCEAVDTTLNTTSAAAQAPNLKNLTAAERYHWYRWYGWGWWWFSHADLRDEKVALFSSYMPRGTCEYTYLMRASVPGEFQVIPTTASEMYFPEVFGRADGGKFLVEP